MFFATIVNGMPRARSAVRTESLRSERVSCSGVQLDPDPVAAGWCLVAVNQEVLVEPQLPDILKDHDVEVAVVLDIDPAHATSLTVVHEASLLSHFSECITVTEVLEQDRGIASVCADEAVGLGQIEVAIMVKVLHEHTPAPVPVVGPVVTGGVVE